MQKLVVQALAMRQLGRLNPRHLLAAGYGLSQTEWCPRTIHTRQLWGCSAFPSHGCQRPALRARDAVRNWSVHHLRFKSRKRSPGKKTQDEEEEDEEEEEEDDVYEARDYEEKTDEDPDTLKDYKDVEKSMPSFRYDVVLKTGLDMSRNKIEDAFYSNSLRLNGQRLIKKSKSVKVGDTLDLVLTQNLEKNTVTVMRVILKQVLGETRNAEKYRVVLRRWKTKEFPLDEVFKS
ncbi:mitochondrial transcription rescue factor 1 [Thalassophryne amazonica]|uniref:mitochondrial transcription rescue factor 1 n=1 Tax=Thalassophryne amazonica TaxID=390379 RepID=UPI001471A3E2|nr:mitochondrial transcription rescue factor 1 [Thalassophryne amazonica]XP_034051287.1 mitochondrial transcription rescue factor 1 [Thalassophryne amazonica]